jgi:hypothetical protein
MFRAARTRIGGRGGRFRAGVHRDRHRGGDLLREDHRRRHEARRLAGKEIPVYYDPADPSRSATFKGGFGCAAVIGIVVGLFFMLFGWMFMSF